jgi:hypothetical protein
MPRCLAQVSTLLSTILSIKHSSLLYAPLHMTIGSQCNNIKKRNSQCTDKHSNFLQYSVKFYMRDYWTQFLAVKRYNVFVITRS